MRKQSAMRLFALPLVLVLIAPAVSAQVGSGAVQAPIAKKVPHATPIHGRTLKDDYFWLREKSNPEVIKHLEAENAYTEAVMAPTKGLQETLYKEMLGRIKQTDLSVPTRIGE
jgi:oligopeptidase B